MLLFSISQRNLIITKMVQIAWTLLFLISTGKTEAMTGSDGINMRSITVSN